MERAQGGHGLDSLWRGEPLVQLEIWMRGTAALRCSIVAQPS
jgi:hypothetical protein